MNIELIGFIIGILFGIIISYKFPFVIDWMKKLEANIKKNKDFQDNKISEEPNKEKPKTGNVQEIINNLKEEREDEGIQDNRARDRRDI